MMLVDMREEQVLAVIVAVCVCVSAEQFSAEHRLMKRLFENYNPMVRPRWDTSKPVDVRLTYYVAGISGVSEKQQTITLFGWLKLEWVDEFLRWQQDHYDNQTLLVVPSYKLWTPDVIFDNGFVHGSSCMHACMTDRLDCSVGQRFFDSQHYLARLYSDGSVRWEPGGPMMLSCRFDLTAYPFDLQRCIIKLVTWANTGGRVNTYTGGLDFTFYEENGEWRIVQTEAKNFTFINDGESYCEVHLFIHMKRKPLFHVLYIVCPIVLLSILNCLVFCLPSESGEKVTLSLNVLLAFSVFLLMIIDIMPSTADRIPNIGVYITTFMVMSSISVITTVFVINMHQKRGDKPVPACLQRVCQLVLCKRTPPSDDADDADGASGPHGIDWKDVARGTDRLAFILFVVFISSFASVIVVKGYQII